MWLSTIKYNFVLIPTLLLLGACAASDNDSSSNPLERYYAAAADSGSIIEVSYRNHRIVLSGVKPEMGWFLENGSNVLIGSHDLQSCLSTDWIKKYTGTHIDAVIYEDDGNESYDLHFLKVMNPSYDPETREFTFNGLWFKGSDKSDDVKNGIALNKSLIVFMKDVHEPSGIVLQSEDIGSEETSPNTNQDITSGIIDTYHKSAEDFDAAVNKMISDVTPMLRPDEIAPTIDKLKAMLTKIESGVTLFDEEKTLLLNCAKESVVLPVCSDFTDSECMKSWMSLIQARIDVLTPVASTVNTATLTTDALIVQAKQSLRDTVSGLASTVFKTIQKLAQQLGQ